MANTATLFDLRGRVQSARPGVTPDFVNNSLNDRLHTILDHRTFWADLLKFGILGFPDAISTTYDANNNPIDTVSLTTGSPIATFAATTLPVNDVVNTTIPDGITEFGYVEVFPASMSGITANSMLYVDAAGPEPETVAVVEARRTSFIANFTKYHDADCTITQSSLANRQFRLSQAYPIFTIRAVKSATTLELDNAWGGPSLTGQAYVIKLMYVMLASDLKGILSMKDEQTGYPVLLHRSVDEANFYDPRRTLVSGNPWYSLLDWGANEQGNMIYEVWPAPSSARQFSYAYSKQWPDMVKDTDRPPPFINPSMLFYGAMADAKRVRTSKDDPHYDLMAAREFEAQFERALQEAKNADEAKRLEAMRNPWWRSRIPGSVDTYQLLDPSTLGFWSDSGAY